MLEKTFYNNMLKRSFNIPVKVTFWDGKSKLYGEGEPQVAVVFNKKIPLRDITNNASLAFGEAYMRGDLEIHGSIQKLIKAAYDSAGSFMKSSKFRRLMPHQKHTEAQSTADVQSHYDIGNDFYRLWLVTQA